MSETTPEPVRPAARRTEAVLGIVGRVLVATGLLLLAFVGYQLWGTGIEQAQRQNRLTSQFDELLATTTTTVAPSTTVDLGTPPTTTSPVSAAPSTTVPPAPQAPPEVGDPVARLEIPSLDVSQVVVMGVGTAELKMGPGHFPGTPLAGQRGNAAIAGHRTSYGAPFGDLDQLDPGDEIVLTTPNGQFRYLVTGSTIVEPTAVEVIETVDPERATLTLVTCHPRFSTRERLIVSAALDETASPPPAPAVVTTTTTLAPTASPSGPAATEAVVPAAPAAPVVEADPFAAGWFADDAAWWHVAGWGLLLTLIALAATRLGRARHNQRLGAVVGLVPFLVVLYFFFQNVNRLLPPGL